MVPTNSDLVRLDLSPFDEGARTDGKLSLALTLWKMEGTETSSEAFIERVRDWYNPEPAHLLDTTERDLNNWNMIDFHRHSFVMDGGDYKDVRLGTLKFAPARIAAEQTYGLTVSERKPMLFTVSMPQRIYQRALLPFFDKNGKVTRVATLVRPLLHRATLAEISRL